MAYSHGHPWTESEIADRIREVVSTHNMDTMPSHSELDSHYGNSSVSNIISKRGGSKYFASLLGLKIKVSESSFGEKYEDLCVQQIEDKFGFDCKKMLPRYPYDILVESATKIDTKSGRLYVHAKNHFKFYSFNLEKRYSTCDIFVCYCVDDNQNVVKTLVIPASILQGITQLSVGETNSKYNKFIDAWHYIPQYVQFMKQAI